MLVRNRWARVLPLVGAVLLVGAGASAQERVRLAEGHAKGDTSLRDNSLNLGITINAKAGTQPVQQQKMSQRERETYRQTVLEVDAKGAVTALRRVYTVATSVEQNGDTPSSEKPHSVQGKTVTIRRVNGKVEVTAAKGALSPADRQELLTALDDSTDEIYPNKDLAPGDEWTGSSKSLLKSFPGASKATVTGKLLEIVPFGGHKCAHVQLGIDVAGQPEGAPVSVTFKMSGDLYYALDIKRTLLVDLKGPVTAKGEQTQGDTTIAIDGAGDVAMKMNVTWEKVGS